MNTTTLTHFYTVTSTTIENGTQGPGWNGSYQEVFIAEPVDEYIFDSPSVRLFFYIVYTIVFCLCFFGNLIVLLVVAFQWRTRSITKFCMGNLAFANFCVGIFCVYQNLSTFLTENWTFGRLLCKMYYFTNSMSHTASILILVVICVERYMSILNPFRGKRLLTIQRLRFTLVIVWLVSAAICSPRLYYITTFEAPLLTGAEEESEVICAPKRTLYNSRTADMVYFILLFVIPLIIMTILYARIGAVIWRTSAALQSPQEPSPTVPVVVDQVKVSSVGDSVYYPRVPHNSLNTPRSSSVSTGTRRSTTDPASKHSSSSTASDQNRSRSGSRKYGRHRENYLRDQCVFRFQNEINPVESANVPSARNNARVKVRVPSTVSTRQLIQVKDERRGKVLRSRQAVIRMLMVLVVSFALCNFPYHLRKICQYYVSSYKVGSYFNQIFTPLTFLLMYTNCAINPILYAFMSKQFRASLRELLKCGSGGSRAQGRRRRLSV